MKCTFKTVLLLAVFLFISAGLSRAQDATVADTAAPGWKKALIGRVSGSQAGFQNWREGGVNTLALSIGVDGKLERGGSRWKQAHDMRLSFGLVKQDTLDFRKAEDLIRFASTVDFLGEGFLGALHPTMAFQMRTQFAAGFNFKEDPFKEGRTPPVKVSDFLSPGTFTQSIGLSYASGSWFKQRIGLGAKETVVLIDRLRTLYSVSADKAARFELGLEAFTDVDRELVENVRYKTTVGLFAAFNKPESPDLLWESLIAMKVNDWLNVNFEWVVLYDTDVSSKAQFKEVLSVGISYIFI